MLGGLAPDQPGYDLRGCFVGSEGTMGIATRIAVRLTPEPAGGRDDAARLRRRSTPPRPTVTGTIAGGIVPAALEMMDARITRAVEDFVGAGYPRDAEAVLLVEVDGLAGGVAAQVDAVARIGAATARARVRVAADDAERALLWKGRKSAFGAIARIAPDYYLHDAVVPRTRLVEVLRRVYEIADDARPHDDERVPRRRRQPAPAHRVRPARAGRVGARVRRGHRDPRRRASRPAACSPASTASGSRSATSCR